MRSRAAPGPPALLEGSQPPRVFPKRLQGSWKLCFPWGSQASFGAGGRGRYVCVGRIWTANRFLRLLPPPDPWPPPGPPLPCTGAAAKPDPGIYSPPECRCSSCSSRWFHALPFSQSLTLWSQPARCNHPAFLQASDGQYEKSPKARPSRKPALRRGGGC